MEVVEAPVEEGSFRFHLPTPEPLGRPILNIQKVQDKALDSSLVQLPS